ncbi:MAG: hypothetical protein AMS24_00400 [Chlamydiae bacterium SM23_39]|nr:MAG: hypothetical protein AMS24_00400 [Chlamydiae bacterium SM23_39]
MKKGSLSVKSSDILPIIKKWLYSDKDIFLRELISNSCDAIHKLKILDNKILKKDFKISIKIDTNKKTLSISDNGIGMTQEEVEKYITQIAFSGAQEFLEKYKSQEEIIGHFGLGFFSSYMVAKRVELKTKSYKKEEKGVFWSCDGSSDYFIKEEELQDNGTEVILHIDEQSLEFLNEDKIKETLKKYCPYLPFSIYLNEKHFNNKDPLWLKNSSECTDKEYLEFYKELYPKDPDPIFWIHLNVDYPFHLKGILFFPKIKNLEPQLSNIKLFCNRVFVTDNCKDLLADHLTILKGAIDSSDIPLNVSRSYLQVDPSIKKISSHISKKISDKLTNIYISQRKQFVSYWQDIEVFIKIAMLQDDSFYEKSKNFLIWKNSDGNWTTIEEYLERNKGDKIFYSHDENHTFLNIFNKKKEIIFTNPYIDTAILNMLESKYLEKNKSIKFQRIDSEIDPSFLDPSKEKILVDKEGKSENSKIEEFIKSILSSIEENLKIKAKSFSTNLISGFIMIEEENRRFKEYMKLTHNESDLPMSKTFVVNTNSKIIYKAYLIKNKNPTLAKSLIVHAYNLALIAQKEYPISKVTDFVKDTNILLDSLLEST